MKNSLIPQMGFGIQETTISKFIKNKRQSLGLSVEEVLQKLHNAELQLTFERYDEIESGKSDPTGDEFLKIKKVLEENKQD
ncbi:helix-turn-helix transcriptional regulator [Chryseobacterium antibioticum]|uniref:Helix-turn-helix transcriptional regulator n=1 Tax=Chryseobacterium pyrolae TaxID=2987481 RepID=A0ABT2IMX0_9FLAO|nr:helix-turn-helix transcriptional regulator [Chryseobacterium pyrolae]MCT2410014.1 helix-turn-helix transcriptional regulator [Chryseobacterium pyrolae]